MRTPGKRRNVIQEILDKKERAFRKGSRMAHFLGRVVPLVEGWRAMKKLPRTLSWRDEWLKYGAIGYVACIEGYFRLLIADLINHHPECRSNLERFPDLRVNLATAAALEDGTTTSGELLAHLVEISSTDDINKVMTTLLGRDFLDLVLSSPASQFQPRPNREMSPNMVADSLRLFQLRHQFAHEVGARGRVPVRAIERGMRSAAALAVSTEFALTRAGFVDDERNR
jgi:hypothetical protein